MGRAVAVFLAAMASLVATPRARAAIEAQNVPPPAEAEAPPPAPKLTRAPELLEMTPAAYPQSLLADAIAGDCILYVDIDAEGAVEHAEVVSTVHPAFAESAISAAAHLRFSPAEIDGKPAPIRIEFRYVFEPQPEVPDAIAGEMEAPVAAAQVNFAGLVREAGTRKPIGGATISVNGRPVAETDEGGRFAARGVPPGKLEVRITHPRYDRYTVDEELAPGEGIEAKYYLIRAYNDPYAQVIRTKVEQREVAKVVLTRQEITKMPGTFGDPIRVIENLPGMARTPGGLGGALLVRGATPSDTAVFIDGVQIPLLYHFGGLTSVVPAPFLERIDFFPGGFGPRYGDAIAGIVDVVTRDIVCPGNTGEAQLDIIGAALYDCDTIGDWTVAAAARGTYYAPIIDAVVRSVPREPDEGILTLTPVWVDWQAKGSAKYGDHRLDIFGFGSHDQLALSQTGAAESLDVSFGIKSGFHRILLRDRWKITDKLTLNSQVSPGLQYQKFTGDSEDANSDAEFSLEIYGVGWREDVVYEATDWLTLRAGLDWLMGGANFDVSAPIPTFLANTFPAPSLTLDTGSIQTLGLGLNQTNHAYYLEAELDLPGKLKILPGLRLDRFDFHHTQDFGLQPRLTTRWQLWGYLENTTLKGAYGLYEKLPEPNFLIETFGNPNLEPTRAHQFVFGVEQAFTDLINLDVQGFYNLRLGIPTPSNVRTVQNGRAVSENFTNGGTGQTYGLEVLLRHLAAPGQLFYGWLAYTLSRSERTDTRRDATAQFNQQTGNQPGQDLGENTETYLAALDQTHILTLVGQFVLPWGLEAGFRFRLVSGNPYTPLEDASILYDVDRVRYNVERDASAADPSQAVARNSRRLPMVHQLDLRVDKTWTFDLWSLTAYVEVLNVYNRANTEQFQYDYRYRNRVPVSLSTVIPNLGFKGAW